MRGPKLTPTKRWSCAAPVHPRRGLCFTIGRNSNDQFVRVENQNASCWFAQR